MLVIERTSDGRTIVTLKRTWHPGRISQAYIPRPKPRTMDAHELRVQAALLRRTV